MTTRRSALIVWLGSLGAAGFAFLAQMLIIRSFSPAQFGVFQNAFSIAMLIFNFAAQGIGEVLMRRQGDLQPATGIKAVCVMAVPAILAGIGWILLGRDDDLLTSLAVFLPFLVAQFMLLMGMVAFQVRGASAWIAIWPVVQQAIRLLAICGVILVGGSLLAVPLAWTVCLLLPGLYGVVVLRRVMSSAPRHADVDPSVSSIAFQGLPFGLSHVVEFAQLQAPVLLLMVLVGPTEAGLAGGCMVIIQGLLLLPIAVYCRFLRARFHVWDVNDHRRVSVVVTRGVISMFLIATAVSAVLWPLSGWALELLFGAEYRTAGGFFRILLLTLPVWFAAIVVNTPLVSRKLAVVRLVFNITSLLIVAVVSLLAAGSLGEDAVAWGMFAAQAFLLTAGALVIAFKYGFHLRFPATPVADSKETSDG